MKCTDCERPATDGRKMCWHCINFKKRYGMTHEGVMAMRAQAKTICDVCSRVKRHMQVYKAHTLCSRCMNVVFLLADPNKLHVVSKIVSTNIVISTEKDTIPQRQDLPVLNA